MHRLTNGRNGVVQPDEPCGNGKALAPHLALADRQGLPRLGADAVRKLRGVQEDVPLLRHQALLLEVHEGGRAAEVAVRPLQRSGGQVDGGLIGPRRRQQHQNATLRERLVAAAQTVQELDDFRLHLLDGGPERRRVAQRHSGKTSPQQGDGGIQRRLVDIRIQEAPGDSHGDGIHLANHIKEQLPRRLRVFAPDGNVGERIASRPEDLRPMRGRKRIRRVQKTLDPGDQVGRSRRQCRRLQQGRRTGESDRFVVRRHACKADPVKLGTALQRLRHCLQRLKNRSGVLSVHRPRFLEDILVGPLLRGDCICRETDQRLFDGRELLRSCGRQERQRSGND